MSTAAGGVLELFCDLAAIPSPSRHERAVADRVLEILRGLGLDPVEDDAGGRIGSDIGNIYCRLQPRNGGGGTPIFLNAHLDTVPPDGPIEPEVRNGIVINRHDTILGADNKAAVAVMLAALERLVAGVPHAGVELVLTPMEEVGLQGAKAFDLARLHAGLGFCYDHAAPIGNVVVAAPTQKSLELRFLGRAAHSGIAPEEGRSAIAAAARAVADMQLGRIDEATTANVGLIRGGMAGNIVAPECRVWAEARSRDPDRLREQVQSMLDAATYAANLAECELETRIISEYEGYSFSQSHDGVRLAAAALSQSGYDVTYIKSGGGADANVFNAAGVPCVNVCNGMAEIHTASEHIAVADLEGMLGVTLDLIEAARRSRIAQPDEDGGAG
ncbi:MAG TPA: M20/M25/M40 family metallo-hydrolase [Gaiellales bacterium]